MNEEEIIAFFCEECGEEVLENKDRLHEYILGRCIDLATISIDNHVEILKHGNDDEKGRLIFTLGSLSLEGNVKAKETLCDLLISKNCPLGHKEQAVRALRYVHDDRVKGLLLDILRTTKSNNSTRILLRETVDMIGSLKDTTMIEPLYQILKSPTIGPRMKARIDELIITLHRHNYIDR